MNIGILGSGFIISDCHLPAYQKAGFNPVAIASRTPANAQAVAKKFGLTAHSTYEELLDHSSIDILDIAVPPQNQFELIKSACERSHIKAILAQKPLSLSLEEARESASLCESAGILLAVNQNMRHDPSVARAKELLSKGDLGTPVFATIDMRGIPHWQPWQAETGGATLRIMSIHHLDCMRHWFGDPSRIFASFRPDPRTEFPHDDGICTYTLEWDNDFRAVIIDDVWTGPAREGCPEDIRIQWRIEGTDGLAIGDIGWCQDPYTSPSSIRFARKGDDDFTEPDLPGSWFPDAFSGTMGEVLAALETGTPPGISAQDNLKTLALVEAAAESARDHQAIQPNY